MYTTIDTPGTIVTISFLFFPYLFHYLVYTTLTFIFYKEKIFSYLLDNYYIINYKNTYLFNKKYIFIFPHHIY